MLSKKKIAAVTLVLVVGVASFFYLGHRSYTIEISAEDIQNKINTELPLKKNIAAFAVELIKAQVDIPKDAKKLALNIDIQVNLLIKKYTGSIKLLTDVKYDPEKGQISLISPEVQHVSITDLRPEKLKLVQFGINEMARSLVDGIPIYTIEVTDTKRYAMRRLLKDIEISNGAVVVTLGLNKNKH